MTRPKIALEIFITTVLVTNCSLLAGSRKDSPNDMNLELAGKCLLYSFSYQRMIAEPFGLEAGVSMLGGGSSESSTSIFFVTVGGKVYFIEGNASPYVGGGFVSISASTGSGPFSDSMTGSYGYINPGFEYRSEAGFLIRGASTLCSPAAVSLSGQDCPLVSPSELWSES